MLAQFIREDDAFSSYIATFKKCRDAEAEAMRGVLAGTVTREEWQTAISAFNLAARTLATATTDIYDALEGPEGIDDAGY